MSFYLQKEKEKKLVITSQLQATESLNTRTVHKLNTPGKKKKKSICLL